MKHIVLLILILIVLISGCTNFTSKESKKYDYELILFGKQDTTEFNEMLNSIFKEEYNKQPEPSYIGDSELGISIIITKKGINLFLDNKFNFSLEYGYSIRNLNNLTIKKSNFTFINNSFGIFRNDCIIDDDCKFMRKSEMEGAFCGCCTPCGSYNYEDDQIEVINKKYSVSCPPKNCGSNFVCLACVSYDTMDKFLVEPRCINNVCRKVISEWEERT